MQLLKIQLQTPVLCKNNKFQKNFAETFKKLWKILLKFWGNLWIFQKNFGKKFKKILEKFWENNEMFLRKYPKIWIQVKIFGVS